MGYRSLLLIATVALTNAFTGGRMFNAPASRSCVRMADADDPNFVPVILTAPLRKLIIEKTNPFVGTIGAYSAVRDDMKRAFAAQSNDGTDRGVIKDVEAFGRLMKSVGEQMSEEEVQTMFNGCAALPSPSFAVDQFTPASTGSIAFEQWVKYILDSVREMQANDQGEKKFFGLF